MDLTASATLSRAWHDGAQLQITIGPVGSGKTTMYVAKIIDRMLSVPVCDDGWRRYRAFIVRNTRPELVQTTLESWKEWVPPDEVGSLVMSSPITHRVYDERRKIDAIIRFVPMDDERAINHLKSLNVTDFYFNEISEIPRSVVQMARGRIGRYQPGGQSIPGRIFGDSNQVDEQHWLHEWQLNAPEGVSVFRQPTAVIEVDEQSGGGFVPKDGEPEAGRVFRRHEVCYSDANSAWAVNPRAENVENLPGKGRYYLQQQLPGADRNWIRRYLKCEVVYLQEGRPVVPEFDADMHTRPELPIAEGCAIRLGIDIGGGTLNPAAVIFQRDQYGRRRVHQEVIGEGIGFQRFAELLVPEVKRYTAPDRPLEIAWADPAGAKRDDLYETAIFDHLRSVGIETQPAPSQDQDLRIEALRAPFSRLIDGKPAMLINARRCPTLVKGLAGAYRFRKMKIAGTEERYHESPDKNEFSHPCEALGYGLLGDGEDMKLRHGHEPGATPSWQGTTVTDTQFDVWGV